MPARIGMVFDRLCPPKPWHALQTSACDAPCVSSGPAHATPAVMSTSSRLVMSPIVTLSHRQANEKGPAARRRPKVAREAYSMYVERAAEGANEADGPFSFAC